MFIPFTTYQVELKESLTEEIHLLSITLTITIVLIHIQCSNF